MGKYYFDAKEEDPEQCFTLAGWIDQMKYHGTDQMELLEAKPFYGSGYFYCKEFGEPGEVGDSDCGKFCEKYKPRNGKNGRCVHSTHLYTPTEKAIKVTSDGAILENNK